MRAFVTSKNVKWCHLIWPTLYIKYKKCPLSRLNSEHFGDTLFLAD